MFNKGDVLKVNRGLYFHFGVYAGEGRVIHFSAPKGEKETNPLTANIYEVSLDDFAKGDTPEIDNSYDPAFSPDEIVERARKMIGTQLGRYNLVGNNCEHFANWCKTGYTKSQQSEYAGERMQKQAPKTGKALSLFEDIRSDIGQKCYDDILSGKGQKRGFVGKLIDKYRENKNN